MKIVYHFDENGAYCGASEACRSPLEDDVYLIPAMATDVMPPATGKNECPDDGSECKIDQIGETVPSNGLSQRPEMATTKKGGFFSRLFKQAK